MLHQSTQRRLCRALFLLACLLPTFGVAGVIAWRLRPDYNQTQLQAAALGLGVRIECRRCATPRPGERVFAGLRLLHPETGALVATLDTLRCTESDAGLVGAAGVLTIEADKLDVAGRLQCDSLRSNAAMIASVQFAEIRCGGRLLAADARLASASPSESCRIWTLAEANPTGRRVQLTRNRQLDPPTTRITLVTGHRPLAWTRLESLAPLPPRLGAGAAFVGEISLELESRAGHLSGAFSGVDLAAFTPAEARVRTHVDAELQQVELAWQAGRFTSVDLCVRAGAGAVDWRFADLARYQTKCLLIGPMLEAVQSIHRQQAYPAEPLAFDELAFRLQLDAAGCRVTGLLPPKGDLAAPGLMRHDGQTLLTAVGAAPEPLESLLPLFQTPGTTSPLACPRAVALLEKLPKQQPTLRR